MLFGRNLIFAFLQVKNVISFIMSETETATSKIIAAALPGVGPSIGTRLAEHFGSTFEEVMDSPAAISRLVQVNKIGLKTATKIKKAWDGSRGDFKTLMQAQLRLHFQGIKQGP